MVWVLFSPLLPEFFSRFQGDILEFGGSEFGSVLIGLLLSSVAAVC